MKEILNRNEKGVTLVALIVTIIVILVIAGVGVSMLSGENGILRKAAKAKQFTEESTEIEGVRLAASAAMINKQHIIEDYTKLQEQLDKNFDNAVASGDVTNGYIVTIGSNVYNVSSKGEVIKTQPETLQSDS